MSMQQHDSEMAGRALGGAGAAMEAPAMMAPAMGAPPAGRPARPNNALGVTVVPETDRTPAQVWQRPERIATDFSEQRRRYRVSVQEYVTFHAQGFLVVKGLVSPEEVEELRRHTADLLYGRVEAPGLEPPPGASIEEIERR